MIQLSNRLLSMEEAATLAMSRISRELVAQGKDIISLSLGEPDFFTPQFIKDAAIEAMNQNFTKYTPVSGYDDLRESIADKFKRDNNLTYTKDQIVVSTGAKQSIANVVMSCINNGDEVIIPAPYWVSYIEIVKLAEGIPVIVNAEIDTNFKITAAQLEKAITPKTRMMIFSTPCTPTGSVYSKEELKSLATVIAKYPNMVVISDEIYETLCYDGRSGTIVAGLSEEAFDRTITVSGFSKAYAMTGWRLGYAAGPKHIIAAMDAYQGHATGNTCSITQYAGLEALTGDQSGVEEMRLAFEKRRKLVLSILDDIPGVRYAVPHGAFYVLADVSALLGKSFRGERLTSDDRFSELLMEHALVSVVPGSGFYAPGCVRISYAIDEGRLAEAGRRIKAFIEELV